MPRSGQNPIKWVQDVPQTAEVTVTTAVFIPQLEGFWAESLAVLKLCLQSMRANTDIHFDLVVFDNGSCAEVRDYLLDLYEQKQIQQLILSSENVGKVGAWNVLFTSAQSDIVSYCDSDVYFFKDWLKDSIEVLKAFPKAGIVTAQPIAGYNLAKTRTGVLAKQDPTIAREEGVLIPDQYLRACIAGLGAGEDLYMERQIQRNDLCIEKNGVRAYTTASHFQLTTRRSLLVQLFPDQPEMLLGKDYQFGDKMLDLGYWRLCTETYLAHHMGNRLPDLKAEVPWENENISGATPLSRPNKGPLKIRNRYIRRFLRWLNTTSYNLLYTTRD